MADRQFLIMSCTVAVRDPAAHSSSRVPFPLARRPGPWQTALCVCRVLRAHASSPGRAGVAQRSEPPAAQCSSHKKNKFFGGRGGSPEAGGGRAKQQPHSWGALQCPPDQKSSFCQRPNDGTRHLLRDVAAPEAKSVTRIVSTHPGKPEFGGTQKKKLFFTTERWDKAPPPRCSAA